MSVLSVEESRTPPAINHRVPIATIRRMKRMKKLELTIASDYVPSWTVVDGIRELFQNALDQGNYSWHFAAGTLTLTNKDTSLSTSSLLLGASTKVGDPTTVGQFGEGYKIATLVLLREGKQVEIFTDSEVWRPRFVKSRRYGADVLTFFIEHSRKTSDLVVKVHGISHEEWDLIAASNLHIREDYNVLHTTGIGQIIDLPGKVFVNGLHVCDFAPYQKGYNFKPGQLRLDRDRKLATDFDLKWLASRMWREAEEGILDVLKLLEDDAADVEYVPDLWSIAALCIAAHQRFVAQYGEYAIPVSTQAEAEKVPSNYKAVIVPNGLKRVILASPNFLLPAEMTETPLKKWYDKYEHLLTDEAKEEFPW